ncbi:MAG: T9SS type A sorting domain-containing protein [Saprospiraceae bacterium]|nr:T9SS type A sorting domain-containing protein [Saprospiraceae bacterium]
MKSEKFTFTRHIGFGRFIKMSMLSVLLTIWYSGLQAQSCSLACNNLVQVSMDEDCIVEITPDMMLEGQGVPANCTYVVQVLNLNGQPLAPPAGYIGNKWITSANVGQTLQVKVWLTSVGGNSCWGTIKIEDKLAPTIVCPAADTIACYDPRTFGFPTAYDNCNGNGLTPLPQTPIPSVFLLSDVTTDLGCDPKYRARRVIKYQAKDASGNLSAICERVVYYRKITLANVKFPKNYDSTQGNRPHLKCDGGWDWNQYKSITTVPFPTNDWDIPKPNSLGVLVKNYYPDPDETGAPYVADGSNVAGYINGYIVAAPGNVDCVIGTKVDPLDQEEYVMNGCTLLPYRVDTFYNPIIGNNNICKINTTYSDTKIDICPKSFKVLRAWTVLDWCSGLLSTKYQVIKVVDDEAPVVTAPADLTSSLAPGILVAGIISADPYSCTGTWTVRPPKTISDCNATTWTVKIKKADHLGNDPGDDVPFVSQDGNIQVTGTYPNFTIVGLPLGRTWIQYIVTDACDNTSTEARTEVDVFDTTPPVPVCDEFTIVTLSNNGWAHVYAETFDDGSHDNCSAVTFSVRRLTAGCNSNGSTDEATNPFGPFVQFCCTDVGKEVMVELRVTDAFGNKNSCMVVVTTQDKVPPVITCPLNVTINCGADTSSTVLGRPVFSTTPLSTPYYTDNCPNPQLSWTNSGVIDNCGQGVITRIFKVTDNGGKTDTCHQTITVRNNTPYNGPNWSTVPSPKEVTGCMNVDTDPAKTGSPTIGAGACSQVAYTYEDQVFPFVDGVCFKILRKWTVIDWCKFAPNKAPNGQTYPSAPTSFVSTPAENWKINTWTYTQIIKVSENDKPTDLVCSKADTDAFGENCNGYVELKNTAKDCTPAAQLRWKYVIDPNNDGVAPFINGTTNDASGTFSVGSHKITWTVEDMCGNEATCSYIFKVLDKKKPTPYCISELTTVVMPTTGAIEIWAKDFDKGSGDNCPLTGCGLRFTFNGFKPPVSATEVLFNSAGTVMGAWPTTNTSLLTRYESGELQRWLPSTCSSAKMYTCDDIGANTENMSVWDAASNTDYCTVTLNVQSNTNCKKGSKIAGNIGTDANEMVQNVSVLLQNMNSSETKAIITDDKGHFEFIGMPENTPYKITPEKDTDHLNGVSTLDLVLIQRHILGLAKLSSAYKYVAADINNDNNITAADLVELRKLILGIYTEFPKNTSWKFVDKSANVSDVTRVWDANQYVNIDNFNTSMMENNFVAIKIGDVNASAAVNANVPNTESRTAKTLSLVTNDQAYTAGDIVRMDITADNFVNMTGAQWTLGFDAASMEYSKIEAGALKITNDNVNALQAEAGKLAFSWNDFEGVSLTNDKILFTIEFRATANNTIANTVKLTSDITKAEAYTNDLSEIKLGLSIRSNVGEEFALEQNNPNPFTANTTISFNLPKAGEASLTIYDITGKVLKTISGQYPKGQNEIAISAEEFSAQGVMFYELESNGLKATKKMIYLNK